MANEFITASDGPDTRDNYFSSSNYISFADREEFETPVETDLLPDEEYISEADSRSYMRNYEYDVAVIGGGPAGQCAAIKASRLGAKVIMFEREALGGLWLNAGCIPVKTYLTPSGDVYDFGKAVSNKNSIVSKLTSDYARKLRASRVRIEAGEATLNNSHEIACRGRVYSASNIILCSGSKADDLQIPNASHPGVFTTNEIFKLDEVPSRLLVLGGNSEGCELALAFALYGSNVMIVESASSLLPGWDTQVSDAVSKALSAKGVKIHTGITVKELGDRNGNPFVVTERGGVLCDKVLISTGRKPDISSLGLMRDKINLDDGVITVNEFMETSVQGIYAAGDITGLDYQTQAACKMAEIAAINAMGGKVAFDVRVVPMTVSTDPEAASIGVTEEEAREMFGDDLVIGISAFSTNIKAIITGKTEGFVKVLAGRKYGAIFGVHIVGASAVEMISEPAALIQMEVTIHEVANDMIHAHPSYSEAFAGACVDALEKINDRGII